MAKVTIIGAGLMGSAMAWPLSDRGHEVHLVGTHLDRATIQSCLERRWHPRLRKAIPEDVRPHFLEELDQVLQGSELILSGVNSLGIHWMAGVLADRVRPGQIVLGITKGLEVGPGGDVLILPEVLRAGIPLALRTSVDFAAIGGPCIAGELSARRQTCVMVGAEGKGTAERLAELLGTDYYHPVPTSDLLGLEVGVALKNAYTLAVGMAYGLLEKSGGPDDAGNSMHNLAAALFAQGCWEIRRILALVGASEAYAAGLPGAGDLYVTSMGGRTVRLGRLLGSGKSYAEARAIMVGETLEAAEIVTAMSRILPTWIGQGRVNRGDLPLLEALVEVVAGGKALDLPLGLFFG